MATAILLGLLLPASPAAAAVACAYNAVTSSAMVTFASGDSITIARSGDQILVNGAACGIAPLAATVTNTDSVSITGVAMGNESLTIDLSGGAFSPGVTTETTGISEIEFPGADLGDGADSLVVVGTSGADVITFSAGGIDLNGDGDPDVTFAGGGAAAIESYTVDAGAGNDTVSGTGFAQALVLNGSTGDEALTGGDGNDVLSGGDGNDALSGGAGNDQVTGAAGTDSASYAAASSGVTVDLAVSGPQDTGGAGNDTLAGIETLIGSGFDDELAGGDSADSLSGGAGSDELVAGLGDDRLTGGPGIDTIDFSEAPTAVTVDLAAGTASGGAGADTLSGVENVIGSASGDTLIGDANTNVLSGGLGPDALEGRSGDDTLDGGGDSDTAVFSAADGPVMVDLEAGTASGDGDDTLASIERAIGSAFGDRLIANTVRNHLEGGPGADRLFGGLGSDRLVGGEGNDLLRGAVGADVLLGNPGDDRLRGGPGPDTCRGGPGRDSLRGCEKGTAAPAGREESPGTERPSNLGLLGHRS